MNNFNKVAAGLLRIADEETSDNNPERAIGIRLAVEMLRNASAKED